MYISKFDYRQYTGIFNTPIFKLLKEAAGFSDPTDLMNLLNSSTLFDDDK